ncbi:MAG: hypothetical protein RLZ90_271 [Pseudomonadota bacterium]|jgi:hypothetical protein
MFHKPLVNPKIFTIMNYIIFKHTYMKQITLLFLFVLLSSCSMMTYTNQSKLSNTSKTYIINCAFWDACYAKAEKLCSSGYSLVDKSASLPYSLEVSCK